MVAINQPMEAVDENTESYVTLTFTDQNGQAYVPTALQYKVDALRQNANVIPYTSFGGALASSIVIVIPAANNAKLDTSPVEFRLVTIKITGPTGSIRTDYHTYALMALPVHP